MSARVQLQGGAVGPYPTGAGSIPDARAIEAMVRGVTDGFVALGHAAESVSAAFRQLGQAFTSLKDPRVEIKVMTAHEKAEFASLALRYAVDPDALVKKAGQIHLTLEEAEWALKRMGQGVGLDHRLLTPLPQLHDDGVSAAVVLLERKLLGLPPKKQSAHELRGVITGSAMIRADQVWTGPPVITAYERLMSADGFYVLIGPPGIVHGEIRWDKLEQTYYARFYRHNPRPRSTRRFRKRGNWRPCRLDWYCITEEVYEEDPLKVDSTAAQAMWEWVREIYDDEMHLSAHDKARIETMWGTTPRVFRGELFWNGRREHLLLEPAPEEIQCVAKQTYRDEVNRALLENLFE